MDMWNKTIGDRNYPKQHKFVENLLLWSQFSSSDNHHEDNDALNLQQLMQQISSWSASKPR